MTPIDIILPVYRDIAATKRSLQAVLKSQNEQPWHLIVINDASPEPEMAALLSALCDGNEHITLLNNEENLGFIGTVNRGIDQHAERDVVLLNSDTIVHGNWLDRMVAHADAQTASITPFSNNATICSSPHINNAPIHTENPEAYTAQMDDAHAIANAGESVGIPTGVGFCMWLARAAITKLGTLDAEAFGKGYGEECDWCMRAVAQGYHHKLACDVFVYHEGGCSFADEAEALKANAEITLRKRHPRYESHILDWLHLDPARPYRLAAATERLKRSDKPVILHMIHDLGGGANKHVRELTKHFSDHAHHLILSPNPSGSSRLHSANPDDGVDVTFIWEQTHVLLQDILWAAGVSRVHVHHLLGFVEHQLRHLVLALGVPFDLTIHDYYLICPQVFLNDFYGNYCGEPNAEGCNNCLKKRPNYGATDIDKWRDYHGWWLSAADRVIAPSHDVANRLAGYAPEANIIALPHIEPQLMSASPTLSPVSLSADEPIRIAIIGVLSHHKGAYKLMDFVKAAGAQELNIEIQHFGYHTEKMPPSQIGNVYFNSHGRFTEAKLPELLAQANPHLIWFPGTLPETYSYTLSQALLHGAPVWVPNIGAFSERVEGIMWAYTYAPNASTDTILTQLADIRMQMESGQTPTPANPAFNTHPNASTYDEAYLNPPAPKPFKRDADDDRIQVGWLTHQQKIDACPFIRLVQPLEHASMRDKVHLIPLTLAELWEADIDALLLARTTLMAPRIITALADAMHARNIPILYDLDDDLLNLHTSHIEYAHYLQLRAGLLHWLKRADSVLVSTPTLGNSVMAHRPSDMSRPVIIPNYLDEALWQLPSVESVETMQQAEPLKVVYIGTRTHQSDFVTIGEAIRPILKKYNASLTIIGVYAQHEAPAWTTVIEPPQAAAESFQTFARWIQEQQGEHGWHIGLAPLSDIPFNHAKSAIKYMEYSCLGMAAIYADLPPYRDAIVNGENAVLAQAENPEAWAAELEQLLSDAQLRTQIALNARQSVEQNHLLSSDATLWTQVWLHAVKRRSASKTATTATMPTYSIYQELIRAKPTAPFLIRCLREWYHRYATHKYVRFIWTSIPMGWQQALKQRVRRLLHGA
jgi:glycosyltransferase involved in cell wall biosynthesis/GT2 family glycosyltransferase